MPKLIKPFLFLTLFSFIAEAKPQDAAKEQDLSEFLPGGFYRKISGDELKCPGGHIQWLEGNKTLTIGAGRPIMFHSFNSKHTETVSQSPKCEAVTQNHVKDTSKGKIPSRTVAQAVQNDCANAVIATETTLVVSKIKNKTVVDLTIQVKRLSPEKKTEPAVHCKYEIGPIR